MSVGSDNSPFRARSRLTPCVLLLFTALAAACGSTSTGGATDASGGSEIAGTMSSGGSKPEGGTFTEVAGADAGAGVSSGGVNAAGSSGESSGGKSSGGAASGGHPAGGASGSAGASGAGGASGRVCPTSAPAQGAPCASPELLGALCFYDECAGSGMRKKATCTTAIPEIGNPVQLWTVEASGCERLDCGNVSCDIGQACVILQGGARIGQCAPHSCGSGPIECGCVTGCYAGCVMSGSATFTCNTCSDPRGCP